MYQAQAQTLWEQRNLRDTISQTEREDALRELEGALPSARTDCRQNRIAATT